MASHRERHEDHAWTKSELNPIGDNGLTTAGREPTRPGVPRSPGLVYRNDLLGKSFGMSRHLMVK